MLVCFFIFRQFGQGRREAVLAHVGEEEKELLAGAGEKFFAAFSSGGLRRPLAKKTSQHDDIPT